MNAVATLPPPGHALASSAVASTGIATLLRGEPRPVQVLAAFPRALYLGHDDGVVAVETSDGVQLPNGLALTRPSAERRLAAVGTATAGTVGHGRVVVGGLDVRVARWRRTRPTLRPVSVIDLRRSLDEATTALSCCAPPLPTRLAGALAEVAGALRAGRPARATALAVTQLLGLGPGSTPSGDDLLAGLVAGTQLLDDATTGGRGHLSVSASALGRAVAAVAPTRTTAISAALLTHAARGEVAAPAAGLLRALTGPVDAGAALGRLLEVGASSGRDLAAGLLAAAELVSATTGGHPRR